MKTIVTQIEQLQNDIEKCEGRLDAIERKGRLTDLTDDEWKSLKQEKKELEKQIVDNKKKLKGLRWENIKTMLVSVIFLGIVFLVYSAIYGPPSMTGMSVSSS